MKKFFNFTSKIFNQLIYIINKLNNYKFRFLPADLIKDICQ